MRQIVYEEKENKDLYISLFRHILGKTPGKNKYPTCPAKMPHTPMITRILKTAEPTMVPTPTSPLVMNTPETIYTNHTGENSLNNVL